MEGRVSMQPDGVAGARAPRARGGGEAGAGGGAGFNDGEYEEAGARLVDGPDEVFEAAGLIVKVKEPVPEEYDRFREGQQLFTYLHLAADKELTEYLMERKINSIAYETVESPDGLLPLLTPMSEVAGRMSVQAAAHHLESPQGGAGLLLGGVPGTPAAKVTIIGGGVVGTEAAKIALGMRALVSVLDINPKRLAYLSDIFEGRADLVIPNRARTAAYVKGADVVIGAVLVHGAKAPKLVSREMVASMRPGSVVVDVAIDQGGCIETSEADHALGSHLRRGGCRPLLRRQHTRGRRQDLDARPDQRDVALPDPDSRQGHRRRGSRRRGAGKRTQHAARGPRLRARGRCPRPLLHRPEQDTRIKASESRAACDSLLRRTAGRPRRAASESLRAASGVDRGLATFPCGNQTNTRALQKCTRSV